jgi:hypothetical protein
VFGRFWLFRWKQLEMAPTYGIMFKRVQTGCGGMKMAHVKTTKNGVRSRKTKNDPMGVQNENDQFRWKQTHIWYHVQTDANKSWRDENGLE